MSNFNWGYPNTVWFGNGRIKDLPKACKVLGIKNPLFVTDKDLAKVKMVEDTLEINKRAKLPTAIFSDLKGNPLGSQVKKGVEVFKNGNHDGVIAFGGGSSLDVGKSIVLQAALNKPLWDFTDGGSFWNENNFSESMAKNKISNPDNLKPFIAVPTTAGTGSETGRASAIINKKTGVKKIIFHPKFLPSIVILDPVLIVDLSPRLTAATGMDALAHNLEAFCAPGFHPMADGIAIEGMKLIKKSLLQAVSNGNDLNARTDLLAAASMGSTAFQKGLGAIHSLSHPVNAQFNVHHGLSNAIFMPYVLTFNKDKIEKRIVSICDYLNLDKSFDSFLNWILQLRKELKIPHKLSEVIEVDNINLDQLSKMAIEDPSTATNPKKMTVDDMKILYTHSISGELF